MTTPQITMVDLESPFEADKLLEIRTSGMKPMPGLTITSGIDKQICDGPMKIGKLGLEGDEHDLVFHGGLDKAILGYCSSHYPQWCESYPERAERFVPGGFGENFVTAHMNERNVCIGDVISVGPDVLLQVSLPRSPCFKLNHRFSLKNFAPVTSQTSRTGWYYRVLREGTVRVGDELRLVQRRWPKWTIERIQEYLHRRTDNLEMNKELADVDDLGDEARGQFRRRVAKANRKLESKKEKFHDYRLVSRKMETSRVVSLVFEAVDQTLRKENGAEEGSHARIRLPNGLERSYSVVSGEEKETGHVFELGVALDENSRGGSKYLHDDAQVGSLIQVGNFTTSVAPKGSASMHVFIVGGIGITAFVALLRTYNEIHWDFRVHYGVRSGDDVPFRERLEPFAQNIIFYDASKGERMSVGSIVKGMPWNSHLYVCGPDRMLQAAQGAISDAGLPDDEYHLEAFAADISGDPFEAEVVNRNGKVVKVDQDETLLEVLKRDGEDIASSCEAGNCGTCKISVKNGVVDHRGTALTGDEKQSAMLSCVSRGLGRIAIEI